MKKIRNLWWVVLTFLMGLQFSACEEDDVILEDLIGEWRSESISYINPYDDPWSDWDDWVDWDDGFFTEKTSNYTLIFGIDGRGQYSIDYPYRKFPFTWTTEGRTLKIWLNQGRRVYEFHLRQLEGRRMRISPNRGPIDEIKFEKVGGPITY